MALVEIKVPDIGDFDEVAVIELLVKVGDTVKAEQSLITVESDKASMEIPCSQAGVVKELKVKLGDKVKEGSVVLVLEGEASSAATSAPAAAPSQASAPVAAKAAPAPAAPVVASIPNASSVVIVERYATLGGVCLNVGCIPSKALLHVAAVMDEVSHMADLGVDFGTPKVNIEKLRTHKEKVIGKLTGGLAAMAKMRKVTTVRGVGEFVSAHHVVVEETTGTGQEKTGVKKVVAFKNCIIAAGSQAVRLPFMPNDPRVVDSTGALALKEVPKRM
ncbi:MAG: dihydrolipoyl dehydrogenase, partial [Betaproteobacteria bacterium]|nr:dihydrolipoyl dehydrogenase [Betaproteobacteria bacterium]